jgi:hypothetical protein
LVKDIRKDFGVLTQSVKDPEPGSEGPEAELAKFILELFDNALTHGCASSTDPASNRKLRFIRFRKLVGEPSQLMDRTRRSLPLLSTHFDKSLKLNTEWNAFIEVNISDFGKGIVDSFLASPTGEKYGSSDRSSTLSRLLHSDLTSNSLDQNAGLGIQKALEAANGLKAFVSVRTNEFWLGRSYVVNPDGIELEPLAPPGLGRVAGTHWQIIWPAKVNS